MRSFRPFPVSVSVSVLCLFDPNGSIALPLNTLRAYLPPQLLYLCLDILIVLSSLLLLFCTADVMTHRYVLATHDREPGLAVQFTSNDNTLALNTSFCITCVRECSH